MKHIFFIHSYITYLVSSKVIERECLNREDCVFLINRKVIINDTVLKYQIDYLCKSDAIPITGNLLGCWKQLKQIDRFIDKVTSGKNFNLYCPSTRSRFIRILLTNKKCLGYHFIEEGLASYNTLDEVNKKVVNQAFTLKEKINKFLCYGSRLPELLFYDVNYKKVYGINENSFPGFQNKVILNDYNIDGNNARNANYDNAHILVFDALIEFKMLTIEDFLLSLQKLTEYFFKNSVNVVYYKLHPEQLKVNGSGNCIKEILNKENRVRFLQMPEDVILEMVVAKNLNLTFYVIVSSVGLYAAFCGHTVYSFMDSLKEYNERFRKLIEDLPKVFTEVLIQMKL